MPLSSYSEGMRFDSETTRLMGLAYEMARATLRGADQTEPACSIIAKRILELASDGIVDPDRLCEEALIRLRKTELPD